MLRRMNTRRAFLAASAAALTLTPRSRAQTGTPLHIATNTYPWGTFAGREGKAFPLHTDESLSAIAASGITGYEPGMGGPQECDGLAARLKAHGLEMRSIYVNSTLHDEASAAQSIAGVLAIARRAVELGTRIVVTNPSPIGGQNKTDAQLRTQAAALDKLGAELRKAGLTLAYHNHDVELRQGAREFHHMLTATSPENVKFCLDAHWVFRGCGDSQIALFDAVEHYGSRIVELHIRQSIGGKWAEVFTAAGDIDYARLNTWLREHKLSPHLVLEQCVEGGSPNTLNGVEAHRRSLENAVKLFGAQV